MDRQLVPLLKKLTVQSQRRALKSLHNTIINSVDYVHNVVAFRGKWKLTLVSPGKLSLNKWCWAGSWHRNRCSPKIPLFHSYLGLFILGKCIHLIFCDDSLCRLARVLHHWMVCFWYYFFLGFYLRFLDTHSLEAQRGKVTYSLGALF